MEYGTSFADARTTDIAQDLIVSNLIRGASLASCIRLVRVTKFFLLNSMSLECFESSTAFTFAVTHLYDKVLASCSDSDVVLLLKAASP